MLIGIIEINIKIYICMHYNYISSSLYYAYFSMDSMPLDPHITDNLGEDFLKPGYIYCPLYTHLKKMTKKIDTNINTWW